MELQRLLPLVSSALARFRLDRDYDDLAQELAIIGLKLDDEMTDGGAVRVLKLRAIDWLRRRDGRMLATGQERHNRRHISLEGLMDDPDWLLPRSELPMKPSLFLGLKGRTALIVDLRWAGYTGREIAEALGVTDGRVSQILRTVREEHF